MELAALRRRLSSARGRRGDAVPRSGAVRFFRQPSTSATFTGTTAVPVTRVSAADVGLLAPPAQTITNPLGAQLTASGQPLTPIDIPLNPSTTLPGGQVLNFATTPTFGSGVQTDLTGKLIDAGVGLLGSLINRNQSKPTMGQIQAANPSVADPMIALGNLLKGKTSTTPLEIQKQLIAGTLTGKKKYRHMNVANVRALRRAARRLEGFEKLAKKTLTLTQRVHVKKRRKR